MLADHFDSPEVVVTVKIEEAKKGGKFRYIPFLRDIGNGV